ncbi:hypothetical protein [Thermus filiformis]|uniref:Uncharacterized protein n=1 Tax=Thermus filiformis TaxID=276 RepID=A0A0D6XA23_THEFI|nr:hypothetical protein [Thermus filiformis]KIX84512.1 hypothetical protein THFILI_06835 [Thermus filiformis]
MSLDDLLGLLFLLFFVLIPPKPPPAKEPPKREARLEAPPQAAFSGLESRLMSSGPQEETKPKGKKPKLVRTEGNEILKGVIWHEILKKPRGW